MNEQQKSSSEMPKQPKSYWRDSVKFQQFNSLSEDIEVDVAIVGAGITGITTGYLLSKEGLKVAIIEAGSILDGATGYTTAKLTAQHGVVYDEFIQHFGIEKTRQYYESNMEAIRFVKDTIQEYNIDCDFSEEDAIVYATSENSLNNIQKEFKAYEKLGIERDFLHEIPFNIDVKGALVMKDQAQFHPLKFLQPLLQAYLQNGGLLYEKTTATNVEEGTVSKVVTLKGHKVSCKYVLSCSRFPFYDSKGHYYARLKPERSYLIGITTDTPYPGGMYINDDSPTRSLRYTTYNGEKLILVGGDRHKVGHGINTMKHYEALQQFAEDVLGIKEFKYRWSTQDLTTLDKIPYIGNITSNDPYVLVATGYRKWGMSNSIAGSLLLRDIIMKRDNPAREVYDPGRFNIDPDVKSFAKYNTDVATHLVQGKVQAPNKFDASDLPNGEATVLTVNGERSGAYRDENGQLHVVDTTCTHMGCEVEWNNAERSWDCPCHGSRFNYKGDVVDGPAEKPLKTFDTSDIENK
ncbi:FAD-dependent oxidoreductase [Salirhabdus salicampi]|uniref:FAD-dependent oxidoreductase n=1 Tax=Salirhabdus salicampi TaxID=476102 RepID=UPI0020C4D903|nr:FAD-dependent oxidoreductase [Salirhabdus salicampi]MCP8617352.1 FAD-dependent oxidoreductase [Salirhabdus salicampi]